MWDALTICHLMDLNSTKVPVLHWTLIQSIVWIVQFPWVIHERNRELLQNFGPWVFEGQLRLIYRMQSTREPSCKSTYLTARHSKGHSMSHCRSRFMCLTALCSASLSPGRRPPRAACFPGVPLPGHCPPRASPSLRGRSPGVALPARPGGMPSEECHPNRHFGNFGKPVVPWPYPLFADTAK